jgi:hypothetical protein
MSAKKKTPWGLIAVAGAVILVPLGFVLFSQEARVKVAAAALKIMNQSIEHHLAQLHDAVRDRFRALIQAWQDAGWQVIVTSSYRSPAEQAALTKSNPIAAKGLSWHSFGMAIDVNMVKGKQHLHLRSPRQEWLSSGAVDIARQRGFRWGGDFVTTPYDPVHFDVAHDYDRDRLYALGVRQFGKEKFRGNKIQIA